MKSLEENKTLATNLCGKQMKSPLMLGSGTIGERKEAMIMCLNYGAGAVVNRTVRLDNSKRVPFKRPYYIEEKYMLNADNNNATPWTYWTGTVREIEENGRFVLSISARYPEDCKTIVDAFEKQNPPSFYELIFPARTLQRFTEG